MEISLFPPPERQAIVKTWLITALDSEGLDSPTSFPEQFIAYVNGTQTTFTGGYWERSSGYINVGRVNNHASSVFSVLDKHGIYIAIASWARLMADNDVIEALTTAYGREVLRGYHSMFQGIIYSNEEIGKIAIAPNGQVAAWFEREGEEGGWFGATGLPMEIDSSWVQVAGPQTAAPVTEEAIF